MTPRRRRRKSIGVNQTASLVTGKSHQAFQARAQVVHPAIALGRGTYAGGARCMTTNQKTTSHNRRAIETATNCKTSHCSLCLRPNPSRQERKTSRTGQREARRKAASARRCSAAPPNLAAMQAMPDSRSQSFEEIYGPPENFLEIEVRAPLRP